MPAISRWSRSSEWSRRESEARICAQRLGVELVGLGAEVRELGGELVRAQQPDPGAFLLACLGQHELAAVGEAEAEHRRLRALGAGREVPDPAGAHQVHHQHELAVEQYGTR